MFVLSVRSLLRNDSMKRQVHLAEAEVAENPVFKHTAPKLRLLLRVMSGWSTIHSEALKGAQWQYHR
jgi:hypothetical protein